MTHYSEQDIQDYLDGRFSGDAAGLQNYLATHPDAHRQLEMYRLLYAGINTQPADALSIDLAGTVTSKIEKRAEAKELRWSRAVSAMVLVLAAVALKISYAYFGLEKLFHAANAGLFLASLLLLIAFVSGFYFIELQVRKQRVEALLQQG